ncbi:MAG: transposase [Anaerolineales bacterium]
MRLYLSFVANMLTSEHLRRGLRRTQFAKARCHTIRLKLLKIGAQERLSVRRIYINLSSDLVFCAVS